MHAVKASVSSYVCQSCCVLKTLFPHCCPSSLALTNFLLSVQLSALNPRGGGFMETLYLGLTIPKLSYSEPLYWIPFTVRGRFSNDGQETLTCG